MDDIKRLIKFDSVEEFWGYVPTRSDLYWHELTVVACRLYNNIVSPSKLPAKANYYLFKVCFARVALYQK